MKWIKIAKGVRYREHESRKHGVRPDRYYVIYFKMNGKQRDQAIGWASDGKTLDDCNKCLIEFKSNYKNAEGPTSLKEKRKIKQEKDEKEAKENALLKAVGLTFKEFFEKTYLPEQKTYKGKRTWIAETGHADNWIIPVVKDIALKDISSFHIEQIKNRMQKAEKSITTIRNCLSTFRHVWNVARNKKVVAGDSPRRGVKLPKSDNKRQRILSLEESNLLLTTLKKRSNLVYQMSFLSLYTGMRFSEIAGLKWQNIDLDNDEITLLKTKSGKNRTVYMTDRVEALFRKIPYSNPETLVFPDRNGKKIKQISSSFERTVDELGFNENKDAIYKVVFHTLRHTFATRYLESDKNLYNVKELLGHADITTTQRYAHPNAENLKNGIKAMEAKEAEAMPKPEQSNIIPMIR